MVLVVLNLICIIIHIGMIAKAKNFDEAKVNIRGLVCNSISFIGFALIYL